MKQITNSESSALCFEFRLFVAGGEQHSERARANLEHICGGLQHPSSIEVVDVLVSYQKALEDNIFLTPALIKVSPAPTVTIYGDLSDTHEVLKAIRVEVPRDE